MYKSKLINNGILYIFANIFSNLIPIISIAVFTRLLSPEDYGFYALGLLYGSFLVSICNFGLQIGYERDFFEKDGEGNTGGLFYTTIIFVLTLTLLVGATILSFNNFWSKLIFDRGDYGFLFLWAFSYLGCLSIKNYFMIYYKNTENAKAFLWYSVIEGFLSLPIAYILIQYFSMGVVGLPFSQFVATLSVLLYLFFRIKKELKISFNIPAFKKSFNASLPITPKIFFGVISTNLDKILLGKIGAMNGLGVYNLGQKIGYIAFSYTLAIYNVFSPKVYKDMFGLGLDGGKVIGPYLTKFFYITIAGILLVALFSEELIIIITPPDYHSAIDIATIFSMLYGIYFFGTIPQLIYSKKTAWTSVLSLFYIALNFFIIIILIPKWGAAGAACGSLISGIIIGVMGFFVSQKYYKIHWEYPKILVILSLLFGSSIVLIILRHLEINFFIRFGYKLLIISVFYFFGKAYRIIPQFTISMFILSIKSRFSSKKSNSIV
jgi:O-antigen/teichoic acid export membrane protein